MFSLLRVSRKINWPGKCLSSLWLKLIVEGLFLLLHPAVVLPALTPPSCCCWSIASSELILACNNIWRIIKGRIIWENIKVMLYMSSLIVVKIKSIISGWLRLNRLISAGFILSALLSFSHSLHGTLSTLYLMFKKKKSFNRKNFVLLSTFKATSVPSNLSWLWTCALCARMQSRCNLIGWLAICIN